MNKIYYSLFGIIIVFALAFSIIILDSIISTSKPECICNKQCPSLPTIPKCPSLTCHPQSHQILPAYEKVDYDFDGRNFIIYNISSYSEVFGQSMKPSLFTGYKVLWKDVKNASSIREGDIVEYNDGNEKVVHRIKAKYINYAIVQGDNNKEEERVNYDQIKHVAVGVLFTPEGD